MSSLMVQIKELHDKPEMIRHTIFNIIRRYNVMFRDEFGEMVICFDAKANWRMEYFPEYKAARRQKRKDDDIDWKAVFELFSAVKEEIRTYSPFRTVEVERCEADDIIGTLCERHNQPTPILIISPDKDFIQLQRYPNVRQYSNLQKKWLETDDPMGELNEKILTGDSGDGVPNVLSEDRTFIDPDLRQVPLSKNKKAMLTENPEALGTTIARRVMRNRTLIDLTRTPDELKEEILEKFAMKPQGSVMRLMTLFTKNRMRMLLESLSDFEVRNK